MDNKQAIAELQTAIANQSYQVTVLQAALTILQNGYQSDQAAITQGIADGVAAQLPAAVASATATLQGQVDNLTSQIATANTTIATLTGQITPQEKLDAAGVALGFADWASYQASLTTP